MGFMNKVGAKLATKYGTVTRGKHSGCQIALGNPPTKAVEAAYSFDQIIFVEGAEEKGRYNILEDLVGFAVLSHDEHAFQMMLMFKTEETCEFNLEIRKEDKPLTGLVKSFLGQKTTASASEQEKLELQYRGVKVFLQNTAYRMLPKDLKFFRSYLGDRDLLDDLTNKIIDICLKDAPKDEEE